MRAVTLLWLLLAVPVASAQPTVRVRSETRLELRAVRGNGYVVVGGALRDDLGAPLARRELVVRAVPDRPDESPRRHVVTTGGEGSFRVRMPLEGGGYRLSASFAGDGYHERVEVERRLDLDRADVRLRVAVPEGGRLDLDRPTHRIEVTAESVEGGGGLTVDLVDELDRALASEITDAAGRATFVVPSHVLGAPGAGRIKARSRPDARRAEAQTEVPVVRFRATHLTLRADRTEARPADAVRFSGSLRDSAAPLDGRAVGLFADGEHLVTVPTAGDGTFRARVKLGGGHAGRLEVVARYESDAPGHAGSESDPVVLEVAGVRPMPWPWLLLPLVVCGALLALIARRAPKRPEKSVAPPAEHPLGIAAARRRTLRADRLDVGGRVLDHRDDEPVAEARVELVAADGRRRELAVGRDGAFRADALEPGDYRLRVSADGYADSEARIGLPHRGEWSDAVVRLESMRSRALVPYRPVAAEILPSPRLWGIWTNREVLQQARSGGRHPPSLDDLTDRVEQAYYGPHPPSVQDVEHIERQAEETLRALRASGDGKPADPGSGGA